MKRITLVFLMVMVLIVGSLAAKPAKKVPKLTKGIGYCVVIKGHMVEVDYHRPSLDRLEELGISIQNAVKLIANQLRVKAAKQRNLKIRGHMMVNASELEARLNAGISIDGRLVTPDFRRRHMKDDPIRCVCSTLIDVGGTVPPRYMCSGGCGTCWFCS